MSAFAHALSRPAELSSAQEQVISLLSEGRTIAAAADAAGIHRNTISLWRRTVPVFERALAAARYDRALLWRDLAEGHIELAISTIRDLIADPKIPASVRLRASLALLSRAATPPPIEPSVSENVFRRHVAALLDPDQAVFPDVQAGVQTDVQADVQTDVQTGEPENVQHSAQSAPPEDQPFRHNAPPIGRNQPCPCASGREYKQCCLNRSPALSS
ncbi:MAG: SEC-C metal-binding domain-containing protein [Acidobacteriota bacterium]|nr:SEC-C metal-binding domain-containing protein [Acidobacteriota bacterium]